MSHSEGRYRCDRSQQFHFGHDDDSDSVPTGCFAANWQDNCAVGQRVQLSWEADIEILQIDANENRKTKSEQLPPPRGQQFQMACIIINSGLLGKELAALELSDANM